MEASAKIYLKAEEMFMRYGVKSVTMDDLSRALGISKKTLYQYVDNKKDLLNKVLTFFITRERDIMKAIRERASDAIEEIFLISRHVNKTLQSLNPAAMYDLQKYYGEQFMLMRSLNDQMIYSIIKNNLEQGKEEGLYRNNFDSNIIAKLYVHKADLIIDNNIFPLKEYDLTKVHKEFVLYHLNAIVSSEGQKRVQEYLNNQEQ